MRLLGAIVFAKPQRRLRYWPSAHITSAGPVSVACAVGLRWQAARWVEPGTVFSVEGAQRHSPARCLIGPRRSSLSGRRVDWPRYPSRAAFQRVPTTERTFGCAELFHMDRSSRNRLHSILRHVI